MKVLLVAEGRHELGDGEQPGALDTLVRRLTDRDDLKIERRKVSAPSLHLHPGTGHGYTRRAKGWLSIAAREGFDALVLVIDRDDQADRITQIDKAQSSPHTDIPRAMGVAVRSFDAWMLADEKALQVVLGQPPLCQ